MPLDYHVHVIAHGEYQYNETWLDQYLTKARQQGLRYIGLLEHDEYLDLIDRTLINDKQKTDLYIASGVEFDYEPHREGSIKQMIDRTLPDFTMGSVHIINGWHFDHPDYRDRFELIDIDEIYTEYFILINQMVNSGLFDIIGHLDLVKIWGHRPAKKPVLNYVEPVLKSIKASRAVIEINSAGIRKPVGEQYPSLPLIERMFELGIPVTMGSDAHHPDQVAEGLQDISRLLWDIGYRQVVAFRGRKPYALPLSL